MDEPTEHRVDGGLRPWFTEQEFDTLDSWCQTTGSLIRLDRWLYDGKTRAKVAVVMIHDSKTHRKDVLKYCPREKGEKPHLLAFRNAAKSGPEGFAKRHLIAVDETVGTPPVVGKAGSFIFMAWPQGRQETFGAMTDLIDTRFISQACQVVVRSVLTEWNKVNPAPDRLPHRISAIQFIEEIIGQKCSEGHSIYRAAERLELLQQSAIVAGDGGALPNPFTPVAQGTLFKEVKINGIRGNAHGDLHPYNILLPRPSKDKPTASFSQYILIDLSTFRNDRLLTVDPVHLMLSIIATQISGMGSHARNRLARLVLDPVRADYSGIPAELVEMTQAIQKSGIDYAKNHSLFHEWRDETLLALIGCSLLFAGRDFDDVTQRWFMEVAGRAIRSFEERTGHAGPEPAPTGLPAGHHAASQVAAAPSSPSHNGRPAHSSVIPIRGDLAVPAPPDAVNRDVLQCADLADELIAEVSRLRDNLSAADMRNTITAIPIIVNDLARTLARVNDSATSGTLPGGYDSATIEIASSRLQKIKHLFQRLSSRGTSSRSLDQLRSTARELQRDISQITPDEPAGPSRS